MTICIRLQIHPTGQKGISYDPDNSGKPLTSLGTHEHWNSPETKQYSGNLGKPNGIELISIPDTLVRTSRIITEQSVKG